MALAGVRSLSALRVSEWYKLQHTYLRYIVNVFILLDVKEYIRWSKDRRLCSDIHQYSEERERLKVVRKW